VVVFCKNMSEPPICSENNLRCRSRHSVDCKAETGLWNNLVENSPECAADEDRLHEESCFADVQHLQDVEPSAGIDESNSRTSAPDKREFVWFSFLSCSCLS